MHYLYVAANALDLTSKLYLRYFMNLTKSRQNFNGHGNLSMVLNEIKCALDGWIKCPLCCWLL